MGLTDNKPDIDPRSIHCFKCLDQENINIIFSFVLLTQLKNDIYTASNTIPIKLVKNIIFFVSMANKKIIICGLLNRITVNMFSFEIISKRNTCLVCLYSQLILLTSGNALYKIILPILRKSASLCTLPHLLISLMQ